MTDRRTGRSSGPVLVTGANGLIGSATVAAIRRQGADAIPMTRSGPGIACDLRDPTGVRSALAASHPATVVHTAYLLADRSHDSPREAAETNVLGFLNVVEACVDAGVGSFLYASSIAVYEPGEATDLARCCPATPYGTMKLLNEQWMSEMGAAFRRCCCVRIVNAYDDVVGRGGTGWLSTAVRAALSRGPSFVRLAHDAAMSIMWARELGERLAAIALHGEEAPWPSSVDSGGERVTGSLLASALRDAGASSVVLGEERYDYPTTVSSPWLDELTGASVVSLSAALSRMGRLRARPS